MKPERSDARDRRHRRWRRLVLAGALGVCLTAGALAATAGAAGGGLSFGVAEDAGKYADDGGARVYGDLRDLGMTVNRWVVRFTGDPGAIAEHAFLDRATPVARANGIRVIVSLVQERAAAPDPAAFCQWAETVARRYPTIRDFVIGNEVNATRFWAPQKTDADPDAGPRAYLATLAACYDRLKAVDAGITVIGMGLAPRAVDRNSTKPLDFLRAVGRLYRESGRTAPLMDRLAIHPYPNPNASPPPAPARARYDDPAFFGLAQLDRVKQAVYDAFDGTGQPTTLNGLLLVIDEFGYQTDTSNGLAGEVLSEYVGNEGSPVVDDATQAQYLADTVAATACDPDVADVLLFHLLDERQRNADAGSGGWQSGLERPSGARKASYDAVKTAIARGCTGDLVAWAPTGDTATGFDPAAASDRELAEAIAVLIRSFESRPAFATDGAVLELVDLPGSQASLRTVFERLLAQVSQQLVQGPDSPPSDLIWSLPAAARQDVTARTMIVGFPSLCLVTASCATSELLEWANWLSDILVRGKKDRSVEIETDVSSRSIQAAGARRPKLVIAASGTARIKAGRQPRGSMRVRRRGPGLYVAIVTLQSRRDPTKVAVVRTRPFVVATATGSKAKKAKTTSKATATRGAAQPSSPPAQR